MPAASTGYEVVKDSTSSDPRTLTAPTGTYIVEAYAVTKSGFSGAGVVRSPHNVGLTPTFDANNNVTAMVFGGGGLTDCDCYIVCVGK